MSRSRTRRGRRIRLRHAVFFETAERSGSATLTEVSYSGARLEADGARPTRADRVCLYVWPSSQAEPFEIHGTVASVRSDGFAVEYERAGQELCQWIDALLASGAEPGPSQGEAAH